MDYRLEDRIVNPLTEINTDPLKNRYSDGEWATYAAEAQERARAFPYKADIYPSEYLVHLIEAYAEGKAAEAKLEEMGILDSVENLLTTTRETLDYDMDGLRAARKAALEERESECRRPKFGHVDEGDGENAD